MTNSQKQSEKMSEQEYFEKRQELLARLLKMELYHKSVIFRQSFEMLVQGADPINVIENLCEAHEVILKQFEEYIKADCRPIVLRND